MYDSKAELVNLFLSFLPMNISLNSIVSQDQIKFEDGQCVKGGLVWDFFFLPGLAQAGKTCAGLERVLVQEGNQVFHSS